MEQFDREQQERLDAMRAQPGVSAEHIVQALGASGWDWRLYTPVIALALQYELPLVAVNLSRAEARRVMQHGLAASGFDDVVPPAVASEQAAIIEASHCGMLDAATARSMALAQIARDQFMARQIVRWRERGVVLLAGNGHVRRDISVPRWLPDGLGVRVLAWVEEGGGDAAQAFDEATPVPAAPRGDPCAALRR